MTKTSYTATVPDASESVEITTARKIQWATWGFEAKTGEWSHLGWSVRTSQIQAESSARSTGPYFDRWMATPVQG